MVAFSDLRSLAGNIVNLSSLIPILRPFLDELWAARRAADSKHDCDPVRGYSRTGSHAPVGCIWTKQIQMALYWFDACCAQTHGPLQRVFTLSAYLRTGTAVDIYTDASPWGMG